MEVDRPECTKIKFSELSDYPPRIVIDLTPTKRLSAPAVLNVMGLKDNCCFRIANVCIGELYIHKIIMQMQIFVLLDWPAEVDTQLLQVFIVAMLVQLLTCMTAGCH